MAKKGKKGGFIKGIVIFLVVLILLTGGFFALLKFDVAKLGTEIVGPKLVSVPVVNKFLPEMPVDETDLLSEDENSQYSFETIEEAIESLKVTEKLLKEKEEMVEKLSVDLKSQEEEIARLEIFENNQVQFEADKKALDQLIVDNAGEKSFTEYVEKVYEENALEIYEKIIQDQQVDEEAKIVIDMYQNMEASSAATLLETTSKTNMDMVVEIVSNLSADHAGEILSLMDTKIADRVTRYIFPDKQ